VSVGKARVAQYAKWGYSMGMTMERATKAKALMIYRATMLGEITHDSASPRQFAAYGPMLPAEVGARFYLSHIRRATRSTRETWATARILFREPTRARTVHLPTA
jgi:hypothetical protein